MILASLGKGSGGSGTIDTDLHAKVTFDGIRFEITNLDQVAWTDCTFEVNEGYKFHLERLEGASSTEVAASRFTKSGGERFSPFDLKAKSFVADCTTPTGSRYYFATWKDQRSRRAAYTEQRPMRTMLIEVKQDGATLVLEDGSKWAVNPGDIPTACTWIPTTALEVTETASEEIFPYRMLNRANGATIWARPWGGASRVK